MHGNEIRLLNTKRAPGMRQANRIQAAFAESTFGRSELGCKSSSSFEIWRYLIGRSTASCAAVTLSRSE